MNKVRNAARTTVGEVPEVTDAGNAGVERKIARLALDCRWHLMQESRRQFQSDNVRVNRGRPTTGHR
jgi:hypothetical protein